MEAGGRLILTDASFQLRAGDKVGLVGRNGAGKTSLLKVLAGRALAAGGTVLRGGELGYLPQDPGLRDMDPTLTAVSHVLSGRGLDEAAAKLEKLRLQLEEAPTDRNVARFARAEEQFRHDGGYSADAEARRIAVGLGLGADRMDRPVKVLSGGERRRLELARILFAGSDLLLLDEPTNHLDVDAKTWLMKFLAGYRGALLVVSHDIGAARRGDHPRAPPGGRGARRVPRNVLAVPRGATAGRDPPEEAVRASAAGDPAAVRPGRLDAALHGEARPQGQDPRHARDQAEGAGGERPEEAQGRSSSGSPPPPHCGKQVMVVDGLTKGYGGPPVFTDVSFDLVRGERLLILGLNGAGKTSLLRILAGESEADDGEFRLGSGVTAGYYAQEHEGIRSTVDVIQHMREMSAVPDEDLRRLIGMFGLTGERAFQDAGTLSGGEKTKLALAQLVAGRHNLLYLDEPTNNLDPPSREAIAKALGDWPGTMVIVSHDEEFVEALDPDRVLFMPEGTLDYWSEDLLELVSLA